MYNAPKLKHVFNFVKMDFEEEVESHCVRKEHSNPNCCKESERTDNVKRTYSKEHLVLEYIPTSLKHLSTLTENCWENSIISIFNGRVRFKCCLVYGTVLEKIREKDLKYSYMLDDGTCCLEICVFRKDKDMRTVSKLEKELSTLKNLSGKETTISLRNILFATRKQLDCYNIEPGTKALMYGRPVYYRNKVSLDVYYTLQDSAPDRSMEIAFKDEQLDWYKMYSLPSE